VVVDDTVIVSVWVPTGWPAQFTLAEMLPATLPPAGDRVSHDFVLAALQLSSVTLAALTLTV
jgi:hypothetical protein